MSSLILSTPPLLVLVPMVQIRRPQTLSEEVWNPTELSTSSCGNVTHGEERELVNSETILKKRKRKSKKLLLLRTASPMDQLMNATVLEIATHALVNTKVSNADGAWVEPSATEELERPYSNAVDSKQDSHSISLAQLISELPIARAMPATGHPRNAPRVMMVNSQMLSAAMKHALKKYLMLNAMKQPRNVTNAMKEAQTATLLLSAPPLAESHTESATQELVNAHNVHQARPIQIAPKLRQHAIKNAPYNPCQNATLKPLSARSAHQAVVASQPPLVKRPALMCHQTIHTSAHGMPLSHSASKTNLVP